VETDVSSGAWIASATLLFDGDRTVASLVPAVFPAYARVLHPAVRYDGDDDVEVAWAEVARHNGTTAHALAQWPSLTGGWDYVSADCQPPVWDQAPAEGHLPVATATRLVEVLRRHTGTPDDCSFGLWSGCGCVTSGAPTLGLPEREHWLVRGPIELACANLAEEPAEQSAHLWWPADRAWLVATDVDLMSTYVAGSRACIDELLATDGLEAFPAAPEDGVGWHTDTVNPPPQS
jgi:hypothetical protein